jgi:predicted lipoprotein with Yx(FWY)xxD motif
MMRYTTTRRLLGAATLLTLAGCGGSAATGSATTSGGAGQASTPSAAATVATATIGGQSLLVAASNHMTLYQFGKDAAGSGTSACTAACITRWPALTIPAGSSASAGSIGGTWGTIVRSDGGGTQVTYNGLPLYFFSGDSKPGDTNGNYPEWTPVSVAAGAASAPSSAPSPTSTGGGTYGY